MKFSVRNAFAPVIAALIFACRHRVGATGANCGPGRGAAVRPARLRRSFPRTHGRASSTSPTGRCSSTSRRSTSGTATSSTSARRSRSSTTGAKDETFGVIFATARTQVDKVARTVVFENMQHHQDRLSDAARIAARRTRPSCRRNSRRKVRTIVARPARSPRSRSPASSRRRSRCSNNPPQVIVSYSPAILVPIDGAPVMKPVPSDSRFQRVINTRALILQGGLEQKLLHPRLRRLARRRARSPGPWTQPFLPPCGDGRASRKQLAKSGAVDLLDGGPKANPEAVARQRRAGDLHEPGRRPS